MSVLLILAVLICAVVVCVCINASRNVSAMNLAADTVLDAVKEHYEVAETDCGRYSKIELNGLMRFRVRQYTAEGLGNVSVMTVNAVLMQMATIVITPWDKDIPLVSADCMYMPGFRKTYLEFYDLVTDADSDRYASLLDRLSAFKDRFSGLEDVLPKEAWYSSLKTVGIYKKSSKKDDKAVLDMLRGGVKLTLDYADSIALLSCSERLRKAGLIKGYSDGLIENGGVSTDAFVKKLGRETTKDFFDRVLFKTAE